MASLESNRAATDPVNDPIQIASARCGLEDNNSRLRLQQLSVRLHALGPKPLFHFLAELERGADLRTSLETYASLLADLIRAFGGDQFTPRVFPLKGGRA